MEITCCATVFDGFGLIPSGVFVSLQPIVTNFILVIQFLLIIELNFNLKHNDKNIQTQKKNCLFIYYK